MSSFVSRRQAGHPQAAASTPLGEYSRVKRLAQIRKQRKILRAQVALSKPGTKKRTHYEQQLRDITTCELRLDLGEV